MIDVKKHNQNGIVVPLGALYTKENPSIGEFPDLIPFGDFCKACGIGIIQLLPINDTGTQSSPYSGLSAFALHPIYIRIQNIKGFKELYKSDKNFKKIYDDYLAGNPYSGRYNYDNILNTKNALLRQIYDNTETGKTGKPDADLEKWVARNPWIKSYAVYKKLKWDYMQASWKDWKKSDQNKSEKEIEDLWKDKKLSKDHLFYAWTQEIAEQQFTESVEYLRKNKILLKGDMPILMNEDSCDAWAYPQFFNQNLRAGAPADGENAAGQNWGFPTYNWKNLKADNYSWWKNRLITASKYYDAYRLDHILGFYRIWAIPTGDVNALNGHTEPYSAIKIDDLYELGFDDDRIRWLSKPHIPTGVIENITWNHDTAVKILEVFCDRIGSEELWLFKKDVTGSKDFYDTDFSVLCDEKAIQPIRDVFTQYWSNRTLLEVGKNKYVPLWTYKKSTSWESLNDQEKTKLEELFATIDKKNEKNWAKQADEIFTALTGAVDMVPCGEDLGVSIACVPEVMAKHNILGLRVVRWCRMWDKEGQPYVSFPDYTPLSVTTTSVHDSSTIRQWWGDEKDSVKAFIRANAEAFGIQEADSKVDQMADQQFSPEIATIVMKTAGASASYWHISPLQDFLYMNKEYWLENPEDERINIPGTVTKFNWTYRLPATVETLSADKELIKKIAEICKTK